MATSAISGSSSTSGQVSGTNAYASLTSGDFIKVMMEELSNQNPFDPQDSGQLLEQFSSLRNVESQMQLQESLTSLVLQNQVSAAGGLIGKLVAGLDGNNKAITGEVTSVRVQDGKAVLELDTGKLLPMDRVTEIANQNA